MRRLAACILLAVAAVAAPAHADRPAPIDGTIFVNGTGTWGGVVHPVVTLTGKLTPQQDLSVMLFCYQPATQPDRQLVWFGGTRIESFDGTLTVPTVSTGDLPPIDVTQPGRCRVSLLLSTDKGRTRTSAELDQHDWFDVTP